MSAFRFQCRCLSFSFGKNWSAGNTTQCFLCLGERPVRDLALADRLGHRLVRFLPSPSSRLKVVLRCFNRRSNVGGAPWNLLNNLKANRAWFPDGELRADSDCSMFPVEVAQPVFGCAHRYL